MCGICGVALAGGRRPDPGLVREMCATIVHRGPDDAGVHADQGVAIGMRRLSIIDLEGGHQPIANEDGTVWIVFNGEIYNFPDLRPQLEAAGHRFRTLTDTEVVVHGYEEWGDEVVARLNGMFAFALWDARRGRLLLARDRVGIKPLHYARLGSDLVFGSEVKALLAHPGLSRSLDLAALDDYLALEYVPTPRSIFAAIRKLPPGHLVNWEQADGDLAVRRYWDLDLALSEQADDRRSDAECAEELHRVLKESVRKELISDVPLGVFLSGGIDSSAVAAMMTELTPGNVNSFSIGFTDASFDESKHARLVAGHLGTDHRELILEPSMMVDLVPAVTAALDEPFADASIIPTHLLSRFAREHVKVALGGDGGDELFAGYPTLQAHRLALLYRRLPRPVSAGLVPALARRLPTSMDNISFDFKAKRFVAGALEPTGTRHARWLGAFGPEARRRLLRPELSAELESGDRTDLVSTHLAASKARDPLNQVLYLDMKMYLEGDILVKLDRASMLTSLEARVPLLNADMLDLVARLPLRHKLRGWRTKHLLRRVLRDRLPAAILRRPKKGFGIPVARWLRGPLRGELLEALSPERVAREGYFSVDAVQDLVDAHLEGRRDHRKELWTLFMFQRWQDAFLSDPRPTYIPPLAGGGVSGR